MCVLHCISDFSDLTDMSKFNAEQLSPIVWFVQQTFLLFFGVATQIIYLIFVCEGILAGKLLKMTPLGSSLSFM